MIENRLNNIADSSPLTIRIVAADSFVFNCVNNGPNHNVILVKIEKPSLTFHDYFTFSSSLLPLFAMCIVILYALEFLSAQ